MSSLRMSVWLEAAEKSWRDRLVDWDWDHNDVWNQFVDTALFHIQNQGWMGVAAVVIVVIVAMLSFDMTSKFTSDALVTIWRGLVNAVFLGLIGGTFIFLRGAKDFIFSRTRHAARFFKRFVSSGSE